MSNVLKKINNVFELIGTLVLFILLSILWTAVSIIPIIGPYLVSYGLIGKTEYSRYGDEIENIPQIVGLGTILLLVQIGVYNLSLSGVALKATLLGLFILSAIILSIKAFSSEK